MWLIAAATPESNTKMIQERKGEKIYEKRIETNSAICSAFDSIVCNITIKVIACLPTCSYRYRGLRNSTVLGEYCETRKAILQRYRISSADIMSHNEIDPTAYLSMEPSPNGFATCRCWTRQRGGCVGVVKVCLAQQRSRQPQSGLMK